MTRLLTALAVPALRWTVGFVTFLESIHFALSPAASQHFVRMGMPRWSGPGLGWTEAAAALLFLLPATTILGGGVLLLTFALAIAVHFQRGEFGVGALVVYGMAVVVCIADRRANFMTGGGEHDGQ